jgi:MFS family permease
VQLKKNTAINYFFELPNFLSLFIGSFFISFVSPILIEIGNSFGSTVENVMLITSYYMIGSLFGMILSPFLNRKLKRIYIFIISYITLLPCITILSFIDNIIVFYCIYFFTGFIFGVIGIQANTNMAESTLENKDNVMNIGHSFFAIGAIIAPIISSNIVKSGVNWRYLYYFIIFFIVLNIILFIILRRKIDNAMPEQKAVSLKIVFANKKTNLYLFLTIIALFFYVIVETIVSIWSPTFFRILKHFDVQSAGLMLTILWIGIFSGRLLVGSLSYKIKTGYMLMILTIISIISLIFLIYSDIKFINYLAIFFTGFGFSGIVPLLVSSTGSFFPKGKEIIMTILFLMPAVAGMSAPYLTRNIAQRSMFFSIAITIFFMAAVMVLVTVRMYYEKKALKK